MKTIDLDTSPHLMLNMEGTAKKLDELPVQYTPEMGTRCNTVFTAVGHKVGGEIDKLSSQDAYIALRQMGLEYITQELVENMIKEMVEAANKKIEYRQLTGTTSTTVNLQKINGAALSREQFVQLYYIMANIDAIIKQKCEKMRKSELKALKADDLKPDTKIVLFLLFDDQRDCSISRNSFMALLTFINVISYPGTQRNTNGPSPQEQNYILVSQLLDMKGTTKISYFEYLNFMDILRAQGNVYSPQLPNGPQ